jgi:hypothetical protein
LKYCSKCKKVYPDGIDCECLSENTQYSYKPAVMSALDCEPICKCGSAENLKYHEFYSWKHIGISDDPAYCECAECDRKRQARIDREDSMKYLIIDNYQDENKFCDSTDEVEEFLKYYAEDSDRDSGPIDDVLILKLEPLEQRSLKKSDFKPQREYTSEGWQSKQEPNTHIVVWDGELFRVENVMVPELEYDGGREIKW